ncbi:hypothetical protein WOLCODRAFT_137574 [Wolfiporia cocos MD-104 SS10]|uniref:Uncharacterized protein n=1 Tax=Wolfiporia cocos (strain MD-104) TaxID=742152 RepID=A0A2H3JIR3_WOLCO|nr:hypothetical protein WOLCODRAFT_137574 [Wolfiporia cocos MD-104 SS10]
MSVEPAAAHRESTPPRSASRQTTPAFASPQTKQAAPEERPPSTQPARSPPPRKQLSIQHLPLIYQASGGRQLCRMCRERKKKINLSLPVTTFPLDATWSELADHVREMHPSGHDRLVAMSPKEIQEMKLRLQ